MGDDSKGLKKSKVVRRWNAQKKKYQNVEIDSGGHVIKKRKNESGATITDNKESKQLYKKWQRETKRRVPDVGEAEGPLDGRPVHNEGGARKFVNVGIENSEQHEETEKSNLREFTKDKGLIDAFERGVKLTHREGRKIRRLQKMADGKVKADRTDNSRILSRPTDINKQRKKKLMANANPHKRVEIAKKQKALHMKKRATQAVKKGAPQRSMLIIRKGGKKK
eukprot:GHVO01026828.1.p1 GENE.GHVO01026828.1~~GHVO01026828.1.p1  ORF type:complete len:237 (-),score=51.76 GHVO01026828.1:267-935(-)